VEALIEQGSERNQERINSYDNPNFVFYGVSACFFIVILAASFL
jgi:hypothetical protein